MRDDRGAGTRIPCPACGARVPDHPGFVTWCECGWNLTPPEPARARNLFEKIHLEIGRRRGHALFEQVKATTTRRPGLTFSRVLLAVFSVLVLLTTPLLMVGAVLLVVLTWFHLVPLLAGLFLVTLAWLLRPRPYRIPKADVLDPVRHPELNRLVGEIAERVGAPKPDVLAAGAWFNAYVARLGHGGRRGLALGLPLLAVLDDQEWVALLGHEMGHLAHGDEGRGRLSSAALDTVAAWCDFLMPTTLWEAEEGATGAAAAFLLYGVSFLPRSLLLWMASLHWADSQRAEYHADRVAASVSGDEACRGLLSKLLLSASLEEAVHRVVHHQTDRAVLADVAHVARTRPLREKERLRRIAGQEAPVFDATHPPEGLRLRMLEEGLRMPPVYVLKPERRRAIERELAEAAARVDRQLTDHYRSFLHGM